MIDTIPVITGTEIPTEITTHVFSVHRTAINLDPGESAELLSITTDLSAMTVSSIGCEAGLEFPGFDAAGIRRGDRCDLAPDGVRVNGRILIRVDRSDPLPAYTGALRAPEAVDSVQADVHARELAEIVVAEASIAGSGGLAPMVEALFPERQSRPQDQTSTTGSSLARATRAKAWEIISAPGLDQIDRALPALVGLGLGFTPSGDDFIVGYLAARETTGRPVARDTLLLVGDSTAGTTRPGATIVRQALRGAYPAYLRTFVGAWNEHVKRRSASARRRSPEAEAPPDRLTQAVRDAAAHGASSGLDALTGFAFGLAGER